MTLTLTVIARSEATKQSQRDCHGFPTGSLAMTLTLTVIARSESDEAISKRLPRLPYGKPRNDSGGTVKKWDCHASLTGGSQWQKGRLPRALLRRSLAMTAGGIKKIGIATAFLMVSQSLIW